MPKTVKAILPPKFQSQAVLNTLRREMEKFAPFLVSDFEKTVKDWQGEKPRFVKAVIIRQDAIMLQVRVTGSEKAKNKWLWLDQGTRPHVIRPKRAKALRFASGHYQAGSRPGTTFTTRATPASGPDVYAQEVHHPGTKARGWSTIIIRENQKDFERWMEAAMRAAAKASGHAAQ